MLAFGRTLIYVVEIWDLRKHFWCCDGRQWSRLSY